MVNHIIKVDKKIQPLHFEDRKAPEIRRGESYYVCFGHNEAKLFTLIDVKGERVIIQNNSGETSVVYSDEIGRTPEEAVLNTVLNPVAVLN